MGIRMSDTDTDIDAARRPASPHIQVSGLTPQRPGTRQKQAPYQAPRRPLREPGQARPRPAAPAPAPAPARTAPAAPSRATATSPVTTTSPVTATAHKMPFVVLVCGLLSGTLLSLLVISTTLASGSFRITNLQSQVTQLSRQRQQLQEQVAAARSAQVIGERAAGLGMRPPGVLRFIDLKTGTVRTDAGTGAVAQINVPGYTP